MRRLPLMLLSACGVWSFWPTLRELAGKWQNDPQYSHGILVPFFAAYLVVRKWETLRELPAQPAWFSGLAAMLFAFACRSGAAMFDMLPLDGLAAMALLASGVLISQGWPTLKTVLPALGFLLFMLPLPYSFERWLSQDLQHWATLGGTFLLQTIGQPAINEGNVILIDEIRLGIVEACSGLRMLMTFAAFATGIAILVDRSWVTKLILIVSAVPISLVVNIMRIAATGEAHVLLRESPQRESMLAFIHDFNGWMMMPIALAMFVVELKILNWLLIEPQVTVKVISFPMPKTASIRKAA